MAWLTLLIAGCLEVVFATNLDRSDGFRHLAPSVLTIVFGVLAVVVLSWSLRELPVSTGYAVFTALGTLGVSLVAAIRGDALRGAQLVGIGLVVAGVATLNLSSATA